MNIDVSKIEGYNDMTPEQKVEALEKLDLPEAKDNTEEITKLRNAFNKASSDVASYKKQLAERMSEEERKEAERKEQEEKIQQELSSLRKEKMISGYKASYLSMGYSPELAEATAKALADGDTVTVFNNQKAHQDAMEKAFQAKHTDGQPPLSPGMPPASKDIEEQKQARLREAMLNA